VPVASAVVPGTIDADAIPLHKHHINIVKFSSANDLAFQTVLSCINSMVQPAVLKVNSNWEREIEIKSQSLTVALADWINTLIFYCRV
jgi:hypothetical protein